MNKRASILLLGLILLAALMPEVRADKIGRVTETQWLEQALRFISFQDPASRTAILGSFLLGLCCGLLGSFIVVRKMALMGDALSHAVLPGVALGFLWNMSKDPIAIFIGATIAGLLGTFTVTAITRTTKLKEDTVLGMVLAGYFAVGICLVTMIQRLQTGSKTGIEQFLFGQAAAIDATDLKLMGWVTFMSVLLVVLCYKELLISSFDQQFARLVGLPVGWIHHGLMLLLAFSVVISLQAVGVVLVSAMLITPAAAAYLWTDRMHRMLILAACFGIISGFVGAFLSFLGTSLPTGPFMVLASSSVFLFTFLFAPRYGVLTRWSRQRSRQQRVERENVLKAVFHVLENRDTPGEGVSIRELAERRKETLEEAHLHARDLRRHGLATLFEDGELILLTPEGWQRARAIVRNHRLWELYLTHAANIPPDHVHDDAEQIEHILGEDVVRQLERRLNFATQDPHGKLIPSTEEIYKSSPGSVAKPGSDKPSGYGLS